MVAHRAQAVPTPGKAQNLLGNALRMVPELAEITKPAAKVNPPLVPMVGGIPFDLVREKCRDIACRAVQSFAAATDQRASSEAPGKVDADKAASARRKQAYWAGIHNGALAVLLDKSDDRLRVLQMIVAVGTVRRVEADTDDTFLERLLFTYDTVGRPGSVERFSAQEGE